MSQIQDRLNKLLEYRDGKVYWKVVREKYATMQEQMDAATTPEELKEIMP